MSGSSGVGGCSVVGKWGATVCESEEYSSEGVAAVKASVYSANGVYKE